MGVGVRRAGPPSIALRGHRRLRLLYPPRAIPPAAFDVAAIRETSLNNDDLWLKFMEVETGTRVVICGKR
jgi:hypothetical protein